MWQRARLVTLVSSNSHGDAADTGSVVPRLKALVGGKWLAWHDDAANEAFSDGEHIVFSRDDKRQALKPAEHVRVGNAGEKEVEETSVPARASSSQDNAPWKLSRRRKGQKHAKQTGSDHTTGTTRVEPEAGAVVSRRGRRGRKGNKSEKRSGGEQPTKTSTGSSESSSRGEGPERGLKLGAHPRDSTASTDLALGLPVAVGAASSAARSEGSIAASASGGGVGFGDGKSDATELGSGIREAKGG